MSERLTDLVRQDCASQLLLVTQSLVDKSVSEPETISQLINQFK